MKIKSKIQMICIISMILILSGCIDEYSQTDELMNNTTTVNATINSTESTNNSNSPVSSITLEKPPFID